MAADKDDELTEDWDPSDPRSMADYPAIHEEMRAHAPVAWSGKWGGFFTLMAYADVVEASRDPERFTASRMTVIPASPRKGLPRLPLQKDPPESERYRKGLNPFFRENRIRRFEPDLHRIAGELFDVLMQTPDRADFSGQFAGPFTQQALGLLLGLDDHETKEIGQLSHAYVEAVQKEDIASAGALSQKVDGFAIDLVADRMRELRNPQEDIVSGLLDTPPPDRPFDAEELAGMVRLMLIGGHIVPRNFLCSVAWHMASHPEHLARWRNDPLVKKTLIDELFRFYSANQALVRVATRDTEIGGRQIPSGCPVALNFLSANRDETEFDRPMEFLPDRSPNRHIAFGIGPHMCLGLSLAKLETRIVLDCLAAAPGLAVADTPKWAKWTEYGVTALTLDLRSKKR